MSGTKIFELIPLIGKEIGPIAKDRTAPEGAGGYKFRGIDDMYNVIQPLMAKHGVFCAPEVLASESERYAKDTGKASFRVTVRVRHRFYASDGSYIDSTTIGEGLDSSDKASLKAMSSAMKSAFIETFSIPTKEMSDLVSEDAPAGPRLAQTVGKKGLFDDFSG